MKPSNAVAAAIHPTPYPYYASLASEGGLHFDEELKMWVATSACSVKAALTNPYCAVRPPAEQIPKAIMHSRAGEVFGYLMRMNEGVHHSLPKLTVQLALSSLDMTALRIASLKQLRTLALSKDLRNPAELTRWMHEGSVHVLGRLLGFSELQLPKLAAWMEQFVGCLSPLSSEQQIEAAGRAASDLMVQFRELLESENADNGRLIARIKAEAKSVEWSNLGAIVANLIGLLSQAYEGTAGLIGNTIIALVQQPGLRQSLLLSQKEIASAVEEVGRLDPPVQNTRRFVTAQTHIGAIELQQGDIVLPLLAAANRDPMLNEHPNQFLLDRPGRRTLGFGHGAHACPGQQLANAIAASATTIVLEQLSPADLGALAWAYRPSVNGRIPIFCDPTTQGEQP